MIGDVGGCTPEEVRSHLLYLLYTPVCQYACLITMGGHRLRKATLSSARSLGSLSTIFQNLGSVNASAAVGSSRFEVKDVAPVLRSGKHPDDDVLRSIEHYMRLLVSGTLELIVTLLQEGSDYVILDGNKRLVALYEQQKQSGSDSVTVPVFIIAPP